MKALISVAAMLVLSAALVGCNKFTSGKAVIKYTKGTSPMMAEAPKSGSYSVYGTMDASPRVTWNLQQGDKLGFKAAETGHITAVAGDHDTDLPDGSYIWKENK